MNDVAIYSSGVDETLKESTSRGAISKVANIPGSTDMCASGKRHDEEKSNRYASFAPRKW